MISRCLFGEAACYIGQHIRFAPKADMLSVEIDVCLVPEADVSR
jgi:hypothetical protein